MIAQVAILLVGVVLGGGNDLNKLDLQNLQGEWKTISIEINGTKIEEDFSKDRLTIKGNRFEMKTAKESMIGSLSVDATKDPKHIDTLINAGAHKGLKSVGIYYLAADRLMVCYCVAPNPRPGDFKTADKTARALVIYERVKK